MVTLAHILTDRDRIVQDIEQEMNDFLPSKSNIAEFSVSEVSTALRHLVEENFDHIRIRGEISGLKVASSGHIYLSLKDENAVMNAIIWKGTAFKLKIKPEDGLEVRATGKITTYAGRSNYQMIIEDMELTGEGALLKLLEERKRKLTAEGLFDEAHKKPLPFMPQRIAVITSETGAVIRDILHRISERFPTHVMVWPVAVQGEKAAAQISSAIKGINHWPQEKAAIKPDLIILARGGGSLEDLWCFNEEEVVRSIFASKIPIISAVGHETDTSLADYAADKRAPTPTAAAEIATLVYDDILWSLKESERNLRRLSAHIIEKNKKQIAYSGISQRHILRKVENYAQKLDMWGERLKIQHFLQGKQQKLALLTSQLHSPKDKLKYQQIKLTQMKKDLYGLMKNHLHFYENTLKNYHIRLKALSHENILNRGYAMVSDNKGRVITQKADLPQQFILHMQDGKQKAAKLEAPKPAAKPVKKSAIKNQEQGDLFGE